MTELVYKGHTIHFWRIGADREFIAFTIDGYQYPNSCDSQRIAEWIAKRVIDDNDSKHWGRSK
jgi:hypothetical protein